MPGRNGTGPMGAGPMTGRGFGFCTGAAPGYGTGRGLGLGLGWRRGCGYGRGYGRFFASDFQSDDVSRREILERRKAALETGLDSVNRQLEDM